MIDYKKLYNPFILYLIIFVFYLKFFTSKFFVGGDSYYFLSLIFHKITDLSYTPFLFQHLIYLFPQNILYIKIIMMLTTMLIVFFVTKIAGLYNNKTKYLAGLIYFSGLLFNIIFFKLEDDLFGMLIVVISVYFATRYVKLDNYDNKLFNTNIIISLVLSLISVFVWKYAVYFIPILFLYTKYHKLFLIGLLPILLYIKEFVIGLLPNLSVAETQWFISIFAVSVWLFVIFRKEYRTKEIYTVLIVGSILLALTTKFIMVIWLFYAIAIANTIEKMNMKDQKLYNIFIVIMVVSSFIGSCITPTPNQNTLNLLEKGVSISKTQHMPFETYWGYGWFAKFYRVDNKIYAHPQDYNKVGVILTYKKDKIVDDCNLISESRNDKLVVCK